MTLNLEHRNLQSELMDDPTITADRLKVVFRDLQKFNWLSRTSATFIKAIERALPRIAKSEIRILELGCGTGELLCDIADYFLKRNIRVTGIGVDLNSFAISHARELSERRNLPLEFKVTDAGEGVKSASYDIVISSLFLHHLSKAGMTEIFSHIREKAHFMFMSDLERSVIGYYCTWVVTHLLSRSQIIRQDGLTSVKAAFQMDELSFLLKEAGMNAFTIQKIFPFRLFVSWNGSR